MEDRGNLRKKEELRLVGNEASRTNRRKKREALQKELREIEENRTQGRVRKQFRGIKSVRNGYEPRNELIRSKEGDIIVDKERIQARWIEQFKELFNRPPPHNPVGEVRMEFNGGDLEPLTRGEILRAIKWLKNHKAAGIDNISAELIKYGGQTLHERMIALLMDIWENETMPIDWEEGMLVILHKKGDRTICKNFRGIWIQDSSQYYISKIKIIL